MGMSRRQDTSRRVSGLLATLVLLAPARTSAQKPVPRDSTPVRHVEVELQVGGARVHNQTFADALRAHGYPTPETSVLTTGAGTHILLGPVIVGGSVNKLLSRTSTNSQYALETSGGHGQLDLGLMLVSTRTLSVYPVVGFGAGRLTSKLHDRVELSFDQALADPRRGIELKAHSYTYDVGLTIEHSAQLWSARSGFTIGVHLGQVGRLGDTQWRFGSSDVPGGTYNSVGGPYARLTFGRPTGSRGIAILSSLVSVAPWLRK
jgi:hypothetical protein